MRKLIVSYIISLLLSVSFAYATPSNSITVPNPAVANDVISSSYYNANNNEIQTKYNSHTHTDITQLGTITSGVWAGTAINYSFLSLTGQILNADLAGSIEDSKLSQITTASKVSGTSFTGLDSIPAGAGVIPSANVPAQVGLGTWVSKTVGSSYQASTDGFAVCFGDAAAVRGQQIAMYSDSSNPPTTLRGRYGSGVDQGSGATITIPVRKNDYYKCTWSATDAGTPTLYFISSGN